MPRQSAAELIAAAVYAASEFAVCVVLLAAVALALAACGNPTGPGQTSTGGDIAARAP
jgi:hypothetical protein